MGFPQETLIIDDTLCDHIAKSFQHTIHYIKLCSDNDIVFEQVQILDLNVIKILLWQSLRHIPKVEWRDCGKDKEWW